MALIPDWITREDASRALFLVLGALIAAFKDAFVWVGRLLTQWVRHHLQSRKSVTIVQDWLRPGSENLWHLVASNDGRKSMHFVGHFIVTNRTDKGLSFTRVECSPSAGSRVYHVRALDLSGREPRGLFEVTSHSLGDVRIEFGLDPAPEWTGDQKLTLLLTDSAGVRRKVKATFRALTDASR
jgi:hypothetical protein